MAKKKSDTLVDQLKAAIEGCGESPYRIAKGCAVSAPTIRRFLHGERDLTLETASRLASYLGLRLVRAE